jgi:DNA-binding HxlR family transcriptional regulator
MKPAEAKDAFNPNCPSRVILRRIGDRWTVLVVIALSDETLRFTELRARLGHPAAKVLSETLRALARDGLVEREAFAEMPPRVEYRLTPLGKTLLEPVDAIRQWAEAHADAVVDARARADAIAADAG